MGKEDKLFHESWHRIANQRISLRPSVRIHRQLFRGSRWYIVQDLFSNNFYRLHPATYEFVSRLSASRTVEEVWKEMLERDPDNAPGQGDVIELLAQLYHANLLHYNLAPDSAKLFERYTKKKQRILKANFLNIMFLRIPLLDPDAALQRMMPVIKLLLHPLVGLLWLAAVVAGVKIVLDNFGELQNQSQGILAPSNLFLLYGALVIIKAIHEFGHAFAVRRFGGEVHIMGVMFLIFSPLPYMDASAAWAFRSKWKRIFVSAAGMMFEVAVAVVALFIWSKTGPGLLHSLTYNAIFVASVSTIVFNINPLLRYDGYYILSDLLDMPNLHQQSRQHLTYLVENYAYRCKDCETPATTRKEAFLFTTFGILSSIYRIVVFGGILFFVADRFLLAGIIMATVCGVAWVLVPCIKFIRYLGSSPRLERTRTRAIALSAGAAAVLAAFILFCPLPSNFKAPGVLKAIEYSIVSNSTAGFVEEITAASGTRVGPGDSLMRLTNPELLTQIRETEAGLQQADVMYQKALWEQQSDMAPIQSRIESLTKRLNRLKQEETDLTIRSGTSGLWVAPDAKDYTGMWLPRGTPVGQLIDDRRFHFVSAVSQQDVSQLFANGIRSSKVRLTGQSDIDLAVDSSTYIPMEQTNLPSSALGWGAGGDIAIDVSDEKGTKTAEPFYEVRAIVREQEPAVLLHGCSGKIKFTLAMEPLMRQVWRKFRQLVQQRYQI